ncbi:MAG: nucleotidyltransferase domain-containing protein [Spirochaetales bacterium]|nr:nucleotidyltransferase domain-containing protein [Spirochaetales bacterium]
MVKNETLDIVQKYIAILKENNINVQYAYLFGSYVQDNYNSDSDIDLAIIIDWFDDSLSIQLKMMKLRRKIDTRLEPHPYTSKEWTTENPFVKEIILNGRKIA